jgi:hypothetical protein
MASTLDTLSSLVKALEAGGYNAAPDNSNGFITIVQRLEYYSENFQLINGVFEDMFSLGSLKVESLASTMKNIYYNFGLPDKLIMDPTIYGEIKFYD